MTPPSPPRPALPGELVGPLGQALALHEAMVPGLLRGFYLVGSVALGDWRPGRSDVDFVALTAVPCDAARAARLAALHARLRADFPQLRLDGVYLETEDLGRPPNPSWSRPWTLAGAWHHGPGCFEINPAVWRCLGRQGLALSGPAPEALGVHDDEAALRAWLGENLRAYWLGQAQAFRQAVAGLGEGDRLPADALTWCLLGPARILVTLRTGEVASKSEAGRRLLPQAPADARQGLRLALGAHEGCLDTLSPREAAAALAALTWLMAEALAFSY